MALPSPPYVPRSQGCVTTHGLFCCFGVWACFVFGSLDWQAGSRRGRRGRDFEHRKEAEQKICRKDIHPRDPGSTESRLEGKGFCMGHLHVRKCVGRDCRDHTVKLTFGAPGLQVCAGRPEPPCPAPFTSYLGSQLP